MTTKNFDSLTEKRVCCVVDLPFEAKPKLNVAVIGSEGDKKKATALGVTCYTEEYLRGLGKDKKKVKKLFASHDHFLTSFSMVRKIPRLIGPSLGRVGKFPTVINSSEDMGEKIEMLKKRAKFQMKKVHSKSVESVVGHVGLSPEALTANLSLSLLSLLPHFKQGWNNINRVYIKSSMGPCHCIYNDVA